jgi:hypothetical protein
MRPHPTPDKAPSLAALQLERAAAQEALHAAQLGHLGALPFNFPGSTYPQALVRGVHAAMPRVP